MGRRRLAARGELLRLQNVRRARPRVAKTTRRGARTPTRSRCPRERLGDRRDSRRSWLDRCCAWGTHINDANSWSQRCCPCDLDGPDSDVGREDGPG